MSNPEEIRRISDEEAKRYLLEEAKQKVYEKEKARACAEPYMEGVNTKIRASANQGYFRTTFSDDEVRDMSRKKGRQSAFRYFRGPPSFEHGCNETNILKGIAYRLEDAGYHPDILSFNWFGGSYVTIRWDAH